MIIALNQIYVDNPTTVTTERNPLDLFSPNRT
jgi:hypothetical protein